MFQAHQGDVFIESIDKIPETAIPREGKIVAVGESSGHRHELTDGVLFENYERIAGFTRTIMYLRVDNDDTMLQHVGGVRPDHYAIPIPKGDHKITLQRKYSLQTHRPVRMVD